MNQEEKFKELREKFKKKQELDGEKKQVTEQEFFGLLLGMQQLIEDRLEYEGFARNIFETGNVPQGKIFTLYDIEGTKKGKTSLTIKQSNEICDTNELKGNWLHEIEVQARVKQPETISLYDADRIVDKVTFQIMLQEDRAALRLLYHAAKLSGNIVEYNENFMMNTFQHGKDQELVDIDKVIINREQLGDIRKEKIYEDFDPVCCRGELLSGIFGELWGMSIYVTAGIDEAGIEAISVPAGVVFLLPKKEETGGIYIRDGLKGFLKVDENTYIYREGMYQIIPDISKVFIAIKKGTIIPSWLEK